MRHETIQDIKERASHPTRSARHEESAETRYCWHCDRAVVADRVGPGWRLFVPALVISAFASVTVAVLAGPFMLLVLLPMLLFVAALGPYVAKMRAEQSCPRCGREVPYKTQAAAYEAHGGPKRILHDAHHDTHVPASEPSVPGEGALHRGAL
jgi:hypothetical protein